MIPRYAKPEMQSIWTDDNKFKIMLEVEILASEAMSKLGLVPKKAVAKVRAKAKINIDRINEIEKIVKHDVIAFLTSVVETVGPEARFLHMGMTSSDVLDTTLAVQMRQACLLLIKETKELMKITKKLAMRYKYTPTMGRSHGVHAEPTTFGLKVANWYSELSRNLDRLNYALETVSYGAISGAVGTFAHLSPKVEEYVCKKLHLKPEPVSTQIVPRDRHSMFLSTIAHIGANLERIAVEIRHLQRTEVAEAEEPFTKGQKGSSAMPHKRNPIISENVCGFARLLRGYAMTAIENIALWHERDISHSSTERIMLPDATMGLFYIIKRMQYLLGGLNVYPENMKKNLDKTQDVICSGTLLLTLVDKGLTREQGYAIMQRLSFTAREKNISLEEVAIKDEEIRKYMNEKEIRRDCDLSQHFKNVDFIFKRVFGK